MMPKFTIQISEDELRALKTVADGELRDFRDQARLIIRSELERRGFLPVEEAKLSIQKQLVSSREAKGRGA